MKAMVNHRYLMAAMVGGFAVVLMPLAVEAAQGAWLDQLTELVQYHQTLTKGQGRDSAYEPYVGQLALVRATLERGDQRATHEAVNRFMDMLEAREGGIRADEADAIWSFSYRVIPLDYHDVARHMTAFGPGYIEKLRSGGEGWIDRLTDRVLILNNIEAHGRFDRYLRQLNAIRNGFRTRDQQGTFAEMNRFMDMLEAREGGISGRAANALWQYCYEVTPPVFHDVHRHLAQTDLLSSAPARVNNASERKE